MTKFIFFLCFSAFVFCECSAFWFDIFEYDIEEDPTGSSSESYFDSLIDWISGCFLGLDFEKENKTEVVIKNLTTPTTVISDSNLIKPSETQNISTTTPEIKTEENTFTDSTKTDGTSET